MNHLKIAIIYKSGHPTRCHKRYLQRKCDSDMHFLLFRENWYFIRKHIFQMLFCAFVVSMYKGNS